MKKQISTINKKPEKELRESIPELNDTSSLEFFVYTYCNNKKNADYLINKMISRGESKDEALLTLEACGINYFELK